MRNTRIGLAMALVLLALTAFSSAAQAGSHDFILMTSSARTTSQR